MKTILTLTLFLPKSEKPLIIEILLILGENITGNRI